MQRGARISLAAIQQCLTDIPLPTTRQSDDTLGVLPNPCPVHPRPAQVLPLLV